MNQAFGRPGVIQISGKDYAVGLFWQTAEDPNRARQEARMAAFQEAMPADFTCVREGYVTQWGLGWVSSGHKTGMPAAAAALADEVPGNWLAVFRTSGGWWFVAARRDAILPDGDVLYDNEEEPRERFEIEFGRGGWDRVFTPSEWGIGGDTSQVEDLIGSVATEVKLRSVSGPLGFVTRSMANPAHRKAWTGVSMVIAVALVGSLAYAVFTGVIGRPEPAVNNVLVAPPRTPVPDRVPRPTTWEKLPMPSVWADACQQALKAVYIELPGWQLRSLNCSESYAQGIYTRAGGTIKDAATYINAQNAVLAGLSNKPQPIVFRFGNDGDMVTLGIDFESLKTVSLPARGPQRLATRLTIEPALWQKFQELALDVNVEFFRAGTQPKPDRHMESCAVPEAANVTFKVPVGPQEWGQIFDGFAGAYFESAELVIEDKTWSYAVRIDEATLNDDSASNWEELRKAGPKTCAEVGN